jgi:hypothetical protein
MFWGLLFRRKNGLGCILGEFFNNYTGVDVIIPIFVDFCQFSAKKLHDKIIAKTSSSLSKIPPIFSLNFSAKIFLKIITSVPGHPASDGAFHGMPVIKMIEWSRNTKALFLTAKRFHHRFPAKKKTNSRTV